MAPKRKASDCGDLDDLRTPKRRRTHRATLRPLLAVRVLDNPEDGCFSLRAYRKLRKPEVTIQSLPTELIAHTLSYLDYFDLHKNVKPTCRQFRAIINEAAGGPLANKLFRTSNAQVKRNAKRLKPNKQYAYPLHPAIPMLMTRLQNGTVDPGDVGFANSKTPKGQFKHTLDQATIGDENALGAPVIAREYIYEDPVHKGPFVVAKVPLTEPLTLKQFAANRILTNQDHLDVYLAGQMNKVKSHTGRFNILDNFGPYDRRLDMTIEILHPDDKSMYRGMIKADDLENFAIYGPKDSRKVDIVRSIKEFIVD